MDSYEEIENIFKILKENNSKENSLNKFVHMLNDDLNKQKEINKTLEVELFDLKIEDEYNITKNYVSLLESNKTLQEENNYLKKQIEIKTNEFLQNKMEYEQNSLKQIYDLQTELKQTKILLEQKEKDYYEDLQMYQVSSAYEFEKTESKLRWQLTEANKKIQDLNKLCVKLKTELHEKERKSPPFKVHLNPRYVNNSFKPIETPKLEIKSNDPPSDQNIQPVIQNIPIIPPQETDVTKASTSVSKELNNDPRTENTTIKNNVLPKPTLYRGKSLTGYAGIYNGRIQKKFTTSSSVGAAENSSLRLNNSYLSRKRKIYKQDEESTLFNKIHDSD